MALEESLGRCRGLRGVRGQGDSARASMRLGKLGGPVIAQV
jgi:hypothetical protein